MRILIWTIWFILFVVLFAFALNNTDPAELQLFAGVSFVMPLVALLLFFFMAGVCFGVLAMLPSWFRQRLTLRKLRRQHPGSASVADVAATTDGPAPHASAEAIQSVAQIARTTN